MRLSRKGKIISGLLVMSLAVGGVSAVTLGKAKASAPATQKNPVVFVGSSSSNFEPMKGYMEDKGWSKDKLYSLDLQENEDVLSKYSLSNEYLADCKATQTSDKGSSSKDSFKGGCSANQSSKGGSSFKGGCSANSSKGGCSTNSSKSSCSANNSFKGDASAKFSKEKSSNSCSSNSSCSRGNSNSCSSNSSCSKGKSFGKDASSGKDFSNKSLDKFFSDKSSSDKFLSNSNTNSNTLKEFIDKVLKETGSDKVDIIAHGLGGADTLNYLSNLNGDKHVGKVITLGGANALGAEKAPSNVDITSIFSLVDSLVNNNLSKIDGADNMEVSDVDHNDLLSSNNILSMIVKLLGNSAGGCNKSVGGSGLASILSLFGL